MGGTVSAGPSTQSVDTAARLQEAVRSGLPVLIPGAREKRVAPVDATDIIADPVAADARAAAVFDRLRLEHEREKRGAAGQRGTRLERTMLARLWRRLFRGREDVVV